MIWIRIIQIILCFSISIANIYFLIRNKYYYDIDCHELPVTLTIAILCNLLSAFNAVFYNDYIIKHLYNFLCLTSIIGYGFTYRIFFQNSCYYEYNNTNPEMLNSLTYQSITQCFIIFFLFL